MAQEPPARSPFLRGLLRKLTSILGFALFGVAIWFISREVNRVGAGALLDAFRELPKSRLFFAVVMTGVAYLFLTSYEQLAFRYIRNPLRRGKVMLAGFLGYAFSNSISMTPSMAIRYRIYSYWGLSPSEISKVFFFHLLSTWLGFFAVGGTIFLMEPAPVASAGFLTLWQRRVIGILMWTLLAGYVALGEVLGGQVVFRGRSFRLPSRKLVITQVVVATIDWTIMGLVLYLLLPPENSVNYFSFLSAFFIAQVIQIVSHVPGGIGVFEGTLLLLLRSAYAPADLLASLLVYRALYTVLPLTIALPLLLRFEIRARARKGGEGKREAA